MNKRILLFLPLLFALSFVQAFSNYASNSLIVKSSLNGNQSTISDWQNYFDQNLHDHNYSTADVIHSSNHLAIFQLKFNNSINFDQVTLTLLNNPAILSVEKNHFIESFAGDPVTPNDEYSNLQWAAKNDGTFHLGNVKSDADIDLDKAWAISTGSANVVIAILDSGVKLDHPEFSGRIWNNANEIPNNGIDDDNNGYIDDVNGWNFADSNNDPTDDHGHGTNVTGIIGANGNNNTGYAGIDWNCKLMINRVYGKSVTGTYADWISALYYATDNGADVINMSIGGSAFSQTLKDAIDYANNTGVILVAAAGNSNAELTVYPAVWDNVIAVGATDPDDNRSAPFSWSASSGSNYGSNIDVVAPGAYIFGLKYNSDTEYNSYWSGTSQAAPIVSGICGLILAHLDYANLTPSEVQNIIQLAAEDQVGDASEDVAGWDKFYGHGRVNAADALETAYDIAGVEDYSKSDFEMYPNPVKSSETITIELTELKSDSKLNIYSITGELMFSQMIQENASRIQLNLNNNFATGIYFVRIGNGFTKRLMIK